MQQGPTSGALGLLIQLLLLRASASLQNRSDEPVCLTAALAHRALMKMDTDLIPTPAVGLTEEEEADMNDWKLPLAFMKKRHLEKIEGSKALAQSWRMKDRVSIRLRFCLPAAARRWFQDQPGLEWASSRLQVLVFGADEPLLTQKFACVEACLRL